MHWQFLSARIEENEMNRKIMIWIILILCVALLCGCTTVKLYFARREQLPAHGKWRCDDIVVDFDKRTVTIYERGEVYTGQLTVSNESFLDATVLVEGTQGYRGLAGHCIEVTEDAFRIKSTKNNENWWFYKE